MQKIDLNLAPKGVMPVVYVSQYDIKRQFKFNVYDGSQTVSLSGAKLYVAGIKPDGHIFSYDNVSSSGIISGVASEGSVWTTEQMTACVGEVLCQIRIEKDSATIATLNFKMLVQMRPDAEGDISDTEIPAIVALAEEEQYNAEAWAKGTKNGIPVTSSDPQYEDHAKYWADMAQYYAEMLMTDHIYVGNCGDNADTVAKEVLLDDMDHEPTRGDIMLINFDSGNTVNATLNVNESGAKPWNSVNDYGDVSEDARWVLIKYNGYSYDTLASDSPYYAKVAGKVDHYVGIYAHDDTYTPVISFDGSAKVKIHKRRVIGRLYASEWSSSTDSDGYYYLNLSISSTPLNGKIGIKVDLLRNNLDPRNDLPTSAEIADYNLISHYYHADSTNVTSIKFYAKTKPTNNLAILISGEYYEEA